ncbi:MAG: 16S rRNA methyltransferase [Anaerolineae bacterium]|nr:16S rRNA methyltransferase [Anaerolineae bacterium]
MDDIDALVAAVRKSAKYRRACDDVVCGVGERELAKGRRLKDAIKATKKKLHQVGSAYLEGGMDYADWLDDLRAASGNSEDFRWACARAMGHHSSTRERLDILDEFYVTVLADIPPAHSVLDVACGLNPLAIPWMGLPDGATYYAYDIYEDMVEFLQAFMELTPVRGQALACDVLRSCTKPRVDLALILKSIPCLEQIDKSAGSQLLDAIDAEYLLVSFPVHSLGGWDKGMPANYEAHFRELIAGKGWSVERFEFATELAFLVSR